MQNQTGAASEERLRVAGVGFGPFIRWVGGRGGVSAMSSSASHSVQKVGWGQGEAAGMFEACSTELKEMS